MPHEKTIYIILGPTASGKTVVAIELARFFKTSIISADSRQCFRELNIGVAKPTEEELAAVPHFFINNLSITEEVNARLFEESALAFTQKIFAKKNVAVMAGGTGLYIKAFCEGIDSMPEIDPGIREKLRNDFSKNGIEWLQDEVKKKDTLFWQQAEQDNPQRLLRALEIWESTGVSILNFYKNKKVERDFNIIKIGLEIPMPALYERINKRVDKMMQAGLLQEAETLLPYRHYAALQTVGYKELFEYMDGTYSLEEAIEKIKQHTRNYAKRQMTWFKKDKDIHWFRGDKQIENFNFANFVINFRPTLL